MIYEQGLLGKKAARRLAKCSQLEKNHALAAMAEALMKNQETIMVENKKDLENGITAGLSDALLDRLMLDEARIASMAQGLKKIIALDDPVGRTIEMFTRPNGMEIGKIRVPLGVVGIIYESRPNVTVDAAGLCIKTGNAVLLRGGSTAVHSNQILTELISKAAFDSGLPQGSIQQLQSTDREAVDIMLTMNDYLDVLIPRGGQGLIDHVVKHATVPVIETGTGICHAYVDESANLMMALDIVDNGKTQRPGVCNALETLLVHQDVAEIFLPMLEERLDKHQVRIMAHERAFDYLDHAEVATKEDDATEYLDYKLTVRVVDNLDAAMDHIAAYGTHHSDVIITNNYDHARAFLVGVDSACVYVNASTRFTDGEMFGFGAEIGISTQKIHARGPMGLNELTTYKYVIYGSGQIRG